MNQALRNRLKLPQWDGIKEDAMTRNIMQQLRGREPQHPLLKFVIHVPNEGKRSAVGGYLAKLGGLTPGVPDIVQFVGRPFGLELKVNNNVPSPAQSWWLWHLHQNEIQIGLAYTQDEAVDFVVNHYEGKPYAPHYKHPTAHWRAIEWLMTLDTGALQDPRIGNKSTW